MEEKKKRGARRIREVSFGLRQTRYMVESGHFLRIQVVVTMASALA